MKIAIVDEGLQVDFDRTAGSRKSVVNKRGVFALNHPNPLFEQGICQGVGPNGSGAFETETFEVNKALRIDGTAGPAMGCQAIRGTTISNGLIEHRAELSAAERPLKGSDK